jgi:hypothetical protein
MERPGWVFTYSKQVELLAPEKQGMLPLDPYLKYSLNILVKCVSFALTGNNVKLIGSEAA